MTTYNLDHIFKYTENDLDTFLNSLDINISLYNIKEKRYLTVYHLYEQGYFSDPLVNNPKFQEAILASNTAKEVRNYLVTVTEPVLLVPPVTGGTGSVTVTGDIRDIIYQTFLDIAYLEGAFKEKYKEKMFEKSAFAFKDYEGTLQDLILKRVKVPNIGASSLEVIEDVIETGESKRLDNLRARAEPLADKLDTIKLFSTVYGIGRATAEKFYDKGYRTINDLKTKAKLTHDQQIGVKYYDDLQKRIPRKEMEEWQDVITELVGAPPEDQDHELYWQIAGSYRRGETTSGDIDVIVKDKNIYQMLNFLNPIIKETLLLGDKKFIGLVKSGNTPYRQLDIRNFTEEQWPFGLLYNSSGKEFNILLRERADKLGYKLDEYSLFNRNTNTDVPAKTEQDIFRILGVKYLKPEQRLRTLAQLPIL